jgi:hypothetical protein
LNEIFSDLKELQRAERGKTAAALLISRTKMAAYTKGHITCSTISGKDSPKYAKHTFSAIKAAVL